MSLQIGGVKNDVYGVAIAQTAKIAQDVERLFDDHGLDALLLPGGLGSAGSRTHIIAAVGGYPIVRHV